MGVAFSDAFSKVSFMVKYVNLYIMNSSSEMSWKQLSLETIAA